MFVLPPIEDVERIVRRELPRGHTLVGVRVVNDPEASQGTAPFTLFIQLREDAGAELGYGMGYEIAKNLRRRWRPEDVHIRLEYSLSSHKHDDELE